MNKETRLFIWGVILVIFCGLTAFDIAANLIRGTEKTDAISVLALIVTTAAAIRGAFYIHKRQNKYYAIRNRNKSDRRIRQRTV